MASFAIGRLGRKKAKPAGNIGNKARYFKVSATPIWSPKWPISGSARLAKPQLKPSGRLETKPVFSGENSWAKATIIELEDSNRPPPTKSRL